MTWLVRIGLFLLVIGILIPSIAFMVAGHGDAAEPDTVVVAGTRMFGALLAGVLFSVSGVLVALIGWMRQ